MLNTYYHAKVKKDGVVAKLYPRSEADVPSLSADR
jgi:hypothetical protein